MMPPQPESGPAKIIVHIDPDLEAIIPGFLANRHRDLATIEGCLKQGDLNTIRMLGHRMKGDGGGYGFDQITMIGDRLEQAAIGHDHTAIAAEVAQLTNFLAKVSIIFTR